MTRPVEGIVEYVKQLLEDIQQNIFEKARKYRDDHVYVCENYEEFKEKVKDGGFFLCHWDGTEETEAKIKEETQATIRCVPCGAAAIQNHKSGHRHFSVGSFLL